MIVLVCGGRSYRNGEKVREVLDDVNEKYGIDIVVTGAATGADYLAETWARRAQIPYSGNPAMWDAFGKAAGMIRNREMLRRWEPNLVVAFPGGKGTLGMIKLAKEAGVEVVEVAE